MFPYKAGRVVWQGRVRDSKGENFSHNFLENLKSLEGNTTRALILLAYNEQPVYTIRFQPNLGLYVIYLAVFPGKQAIDVFTSTRNFRYLRAFLDAYYKQTHQKITTAKLVEVDEWQKDGKGFWGDDCEESEC